jgi:glutamate-1-semialdehyde 2,1-aminomutase
MSSTDVLPWNDLDSLSSYLARERDQVATLLMEPIMGNTGVIKPRPGYIEGVRKLCDEHGIVLIFDEVIMGFRAGLGGAQGLLGIKPDLSIFAKAMAAGFPVAAIAGRADIMSMIGTGRVNHSGTYNSNLVSMSAGVAALRALKANDGEVYRQIEKTGTALMEGIRDVARRRSVPLNVQGLPSVFNTAFTSEGPVHDYVEYDRADKRAQAIFLELLLQEGVRPTNRGTWFLSSAHAAVDIDFTISAADSALAKLPERMRAE